MVWLIVVFFKQKTAYDMRISDWSSACALPISYCRGFSPQAASASTSRELPRTATAARRPRTLSGGGMGIVSLKEGGEARHRRSRARRDFPTAKEIGRASCRERVCQYV